MYEIRDPIYGFIDVSHDEMKIINSKPFQRLRRVRQLGTTYLLYPSAEHTRFPHSLGVMHVSTMIFDKLVDKLREVLGWNDSDIGRFRQMLRLASLLHDVGHAPFSHGSDELFDETVKNHEGMAGKIVTESEIAQLIENIGKNHGFGANDIAAMIMGRAFQKEEQLLTNIFASELDSDKMDYLLRDSLYTGTKYGNFDLARILNVLTLFPKEGSWLLGIEHDGVEAVEGLILARYFMFTQVYLHRTRRVYDYMMAEFLKELLQEKDGRCKLPSTVEEFLLWDDNTVIEKAKDHRSPWAERFLHRKHLKCVWDSEPAPTQEGRRRQRQYEMQVKKELESRYKPYQVIVDQYQKAPLRFELDDDTPSINVISKDDPTVSTSFKNRASVVAKLDEPIYIFRVYAEEELASEVKKYVKMRLAILMESH